MEDKNTEKVVDSLEEQEVVDSELVTEESTEEKTPSKKEKRNKHKEEITRLEEENKVLKNEYLKAYAEMENTKRRLKDESIKDRKYASQSLVNNLLTPVDMLLKVVNMQTENPDINNFLIGFKMISNQIIEILQNDGLKEIESLGKEFDPNLHEAIEKVSVEDTKPNTVVEVLQVGYMYKDRVIKPAMVKISE